MRRRFSERAGPLGGETYPGAAAIVGHRRASNQSLASRRSSTPVSVPFVTRVAVESSAQVRPWCPQRGDDIELRRGEPERAHMAVIQS